MGDRGVVMTTGANSGIGLATVIAVAKAGFRSVGTVRSEQKAAIVHAAAADARVEVTTRLLDVTDAAMGKALVRELEPWGLVNNAGYSITGAIEDVSRSEARAALDTMVVAPMQLARHALPSMRTRGDGRIVNVSSIYGRATTPLAGWYQGCKHALEALTDALRMEVAGAGIHVALVEPGGFRTGIWEETEREIAKRAGSRFEPAYRRTLSLTRITQPLMGDPRSVATVIVRALTTRFPRPRYLVGIDAQVLALLESVTPTPVKDRVTRLLLGL